ncbi:histidinol-phosphatase HisJ family protein [Butyrivibrio sp. INlla16]|uniref:histidinol-phosphatase HisJ family protein n=1 Tax=Butyrivibrio sp. INlla16 TaxID=1520807 RepID=UPI0008874B65|nr:histidinol-phosphatase HisJ family protein [Butyrivibrio sp. INlla16]SDB29208.1 histidinol-phosphatase (PHP family) [Butyrivibrio sp. INlla16]
MSKQLPADFHMHTHHSGDCDSPMEAVIEQAIRKKLPAICITEHMDMDYPDVPDGITDQFVVDTDAYYKEYTSIKDYYADTIDIYFGIELGMQPQVVDANLEYAKKYPFDFIIGSNHVCHGKDPYFASFYEGRTEKEAFTDFFESTLENINLFDDFDVLGHLDYLVRYAPNLNKNYTYKDYSDVIDEILKTLIAKGKGLDVNTKSLYTEPTLGDPNPSREVLARYKELGGEIITFGSDAHKPENVGLGFETAVEIAKACGFRYYTLFAKRKGTFIKL